MALVADITTYLASAGLGLTVGSSGNLFAAPFPAQAPNAAVYVVEYASAPAVRAFGSSLGSPLAEVHRFQVVARDVLNNFSTLQSLAISIHNKLDHLGDTTLSGVRYLNITGLQQPFYLGEDGNGRHTFACNYEAVRERSTS